MYDGRYIYVMGGHSLWEEKRADGIYRFDPVTYEVEFIPVMKLPLVSETGSYLVAPAMVHVPSLSKIYFFGGLESHRNLTDIERFEIFYVDLSPRE